MEGACAAQRRRRMSVDILITGTGAFAGRMLLGSRGHLDYAAQGRHRWQELGSAGLAADSRRRARTDVRRAGAGGKSPSRPVGAWSVRADPGNDAAARCRAGRIDPDLGSHCPERKSLDPDRRRRRTFGHRCLSSPDFVADGSGDRRGRSGPRASSTAAFQMWSTA